MRSGPLEIQTKRDKARHCKSIGARVHLLVDRCHKIDNAGQVLSNLGDRHNAQSLGQVQEVEEGMVVVEWRIRLSKAPHP